MITFEQLIGRYGDSIQLADDEAELIREVSSQLEEATIEYISRNLKIGKGTGNNDTIITRTEPFDYSFAGEISSLILRADQIDDGGGGTGEFNRLMKNIFGSSQLWGQFSEKSEYSVDFGEAIKVDKSLVRYNGTSRLDSAFVGNVSFITRERGTDLMIIEIFLNTIKEGLSEILRNLFKFDVFGTKLSTGTTETEVLVYSSEGDYRDLPGDPTERAEIFKVMRENMDQLVESKQYKSYEIVEGISSAELRTTPYEKEPYNDTFGIIEIL